MLHRTFLPSNIIEIYPSVMKQRQNSEICLDLATTAIYPCIPTHLRYSTTIIHRPMPFTYRGNNALGSHVYTYPAPYQNTCYTVSPSPLQYKTVVRSFQGRPCFLASCFGHVSSIPFRRRSTAIAVFFYSRFVSRFRQIPFHILFLQPRLTPVFAGSRFLTSYIYCSSRFIYRFR